MYKQQQTWLVTVPYHHRKKQNKTKNCTALKRHFYHHNTILLIIKNNKGWSLKIQGNNNNMFLKSFQEDSMWHINIHYTPE